MPKVTKKLGNNKDRDWESLGFAHKKKLCQHFDTTSSFFFFYKLFLFSSYLNLICLHLSFDFNNLLTR